MMRGPSAWSVAVRKPDGDIAEVNRPIASVLLRHRWLRIPIVRGVIALGESMAIGFRALAISANYAAQQEDDDGEVQTELSRGQLLFAFGIAIGFALLLFKVSPALITNWLPIESTGAFIVVEGLVRVTIFIAYEVIRFAGKHQQNASLRALLAPGLWLQRLTTREPTLDQIEVSIRALREVLRLEGRITPEERKVEVMA